MALSGAFDRLLQEGHKRGMRHRRQLRVARNPTNPMQCQVAFTTYAHTYQAENFKESDGKRMKGYYEMGHIKR